MRIFLSLSLLPFLAYEVDGSLFARVMTGLLFLSLIPIIRVPSSSVYISGWRGPLYLRNLHSRAGIISPLAVPPFLLPFDKGNDRYCTFYRGTRKFVTTSHAMVVSRPWWWICYVDTVFTVSFLFSLDFSREERVSFRWLKMSVKSSYVSFQQRSRYMCVLLSSS